MTNGEIPLLCVIVLVVIVLVVMVGASALDLYALGAIRQSLFLGPILFVAIGHALEDAVTLWRPNGAAGAGRLRTASTVLTVGIAAAGANALVHTDHPCADSRARAEVLARIGREVQYGDVVYISKASVPIFTFYSETKPDNYQQRLPHHPVHVFAAHLPQPIGGGAVFEEAPIPYPART